MSLCEIAKKNYDNERKILEDALKKASSNHTELIKVIKDVYFKRINPDKFAYMKKEDILYVLNNIVTSIEEKQNKSSEVGEQIESDQIDNTILSNIKLIQTNFDSLIVQQSEKVINEANVDLSTSSNFINLFERELNNKTVDLLTNKLKVLAIWDKDARIPVASQRSLNEAIMNYKNKLYSIVQNYLGEEGNPLYDTFEDIMDLNNYESTLTKGYAKLIKDLSKIGNRKISDSNNSLYEITLALHVLNNFDKIVGNLLKGYIQINPLKSNYVDFDINKYSLDSGSFPTQDFEGSVQSKSSENYDNNILNAFISDIPNSVGHITPGDLNRIFTHINIKAQQNRSDDHGNVWANFLLSKNDIYERWDQLVENLLEDDQLQVAIGNNTVVNLAKALRDFKEDHQRLFTDLDSESDTKHYLDKHLNIGGTFIQGINTHNPLSAVLITPEGVEYQQLDLMTRSKQYIYTTLKETIIKNVLSGNINYYNPNFVYDNVNHIGESKNIFDSGFIDYMDRAWGILLTPDLVDEFLDREKLYNLFEFIRKTNKFVNTLKPGNLTKNVFETFVREQVNDFINDLAYDSDTIGFTGVLVSKDENINKELYSQNLDKLPSSVIQNISQAFLQNREMFIKMTDDGLPNGNIFTRYPGLTQRNKKNKYEKYSQHMSQRYDVKFDDKSKAIKAVEMNASETMHVAFNFEFIKNILDNKIFSNQTACYSDKVTIGLVNVNMYGKVNGKSYIENTNEDLLTIYKNQYTSYFKRLEKRLLATYNILFKEDLKPDFNTLDEAIIELNKLDVNKLKELINKNGKGLQLIDNVHYSINGDKVFFNPELLGMIKIANSDKLMDLWLERQRDSFRKSFDNISISSVFGKLNLDNPTTERDKARKQDLKNLFEITSDDEFKQLLAELKGKKFWKDLTKADVIFEKYFLLQAISTEAEIQMTGKYPFIYGSYKEFDVNYDKEIPDSFFKHLSKSFGKNSKRNNLYTASSIRFPQGLFYGVPKTMKVAVVEDMNTNFHTYLGQKVNQNIHDGGALTSGIYTFWEDNSFLNKDISGTKKEIGFTITYEGITQTKYADYVLSNSLLRNSKGSAANLRDLFKKMHNIPFKTPGLNFSKTNLIKNYYIEIGGKKYKVLKINSPELGEDGKYRYSLNVEDSDGNEITTKSQIVDTVFDLWELLGGEWTWEQDENGYKPSESSMEYISYIISEQQAELKSEIIAKVVPNTSTKSGAINVNPSLDKLIDEESIRSYDAETSNWGLQSDSSHLADESEISGPTQVPQILSFYGTNIKLASEVYKTMAAVTMESLKKLDKQFEDVDQKFNFHYQLAKDLLISLQSAKDVSAAPEITQKTIEALEEWKKTKPEERGEIPCLPYDSPEIFPKISSDLMTALNKTSIKTKYSGIAVVLNPSHGMVTLYEDIDGKIHTTQDLLRKSKDYFTNEVVTDTSNWTPDRYISEYLKSGRFTKSEFDIMDIQIGDHIVVEENNTKKSELIDSPTQLRNLATRVTKGAKILEIQLYKGRDLRPSLISYNRNGQKFNFWHHEAVRLLEEDRINKVVDEGHKLYFRAVLDGLSKGYDYESYEDWENNRRVDIDNLNYKPGEQMLPKVNKTIHSLGNKTLLEVEEGDYHQFEADIRQKLQPSNFVTSRHGDKYNYIQLVKTNSEIIITNNTELEKEIKFDNPKTVTQDNEQWIVNSKDELLCKLPKEGITKFAEVLSNNGKKQYIIINNDLESENIRSVINSVDEVNSYFYSQYDQDLNYVKSFNKILKSGTEITSNVLNFTEWSKLAKEVFTSFQLSNKTTSLRIPSQSLQSIMAMQTVAFMDNDVNDGYVNIYEILFQGSDFDIDKAYTLMYDLDSIGRVESFSNLFDYSSEDALYKSTYVLPIPDKSLMIHPPMKDLSNMTNISNFISGLKGFENKVIEGKIIPLEWVNNNGILERAWEQDDIIKLLEAMKESGLTFYYDEFNVNSDLIAALNKHNSNSSTNGYRNKIVSSIFKASNDIINLEHSSQLMNSDEFRNAADEIESEENDQYYLLDPMSKFILQEKNSVGKTNIGIFANAVKANSVLQQYFNEEFLKLKKNPNYEISPRYKMDINLSFNIPGRVDPSGKPDPIRKRVYRIGNTISDRKILENLWPDRTDKEYEEELQKIALEPEVADKLSMLISLSTDNAKELLLDRIKAIPKLSNMHAALLTLGFSVKETLEISMNLFEPLVKEINVNRFEGKKKQESIYKMISRIYATDAETRNSLLQIQVVAQEMTLISRILKVNQGAPSKYVEVMDFLQKLSDIKGELEDTKNPNDIVDDPVTDQFGKVIQRFKGNPVDVQRFIEDVNYRNDLINYMDQFKVMVNIFDLIAKTPHFFAMLKAIVNKTSKLEEISGKAKFLSDNNLSLEQFVERLTEEQSRNVDAENFQPSDDRSNQLIVIDHKVVGNYLSKLTDYTFNIQSVNNQLNKNIAPGYSIYSQFDLSSENGVQIFIEMVESVIKQLKTGNLKQNEFIKHLTPVINRQLGTTNYNIDVDFFGTKTRQLENIKKDIENGFRNIANKNSGIKNINGRQIKLGELFYLYNIICYKSKLGGFTKTMKNIDEILHSELKSKLDDEYRTFGLTPRENIMSEWGKLTQYVAALSVKEKLISLGNEKQLNLNNKYIYTYTKPVNEINLGEFLSILQQEYGSENGNYRLKLKLKCD